MSDPAQTPETPLIPLPPSPPHSQLPGKGLKQFRRMLEKTYGHGVTQSTSFRPCSPYGNVTLTASNETSSSGVPHSSAKVLMTAGSLGISFGEGRGEGRRSGGLEGEAGRQ